MIASCFGVPCGSTPLDHDQVLLAEVVARALSGAAFHEPRIAPRWPLRKTSTAEPAAIGAAKGECRLRTRMNFTEALVHRAADH